MKQTILIILATCSLAACKSAPRFEVQVRRLWSVQFDTCYCQFYDINTVAKQTNFEPCHTFFIREYPKEPVLANRLYCDDLAGFNAEDLATYITPKAKEVIRWGADNCK